MRLDDGSQSGGLTVSITKGPADALVTNTSLKSTAVVNETKKCGQCERAMQGPYLDGSTPDAPKLMIGVQNVPADTEIEFNVAFKNALEAQECQTLSVETVSCDNDFVFPAATVQRKDGHECPLRISSSASFPIKKIGQQVASTGAANTITVTFRPQFALSGSKKSEITIRGLRGSATSDSMITVLGSGSDKFQSKARWTQGSGTLVLKVAAAATVPADANTTVNFELMNPKYTQTAQTVEILASGDVSHAAECMTVDTDPTKQPMRVQAATFATKRIHTSSQASGGTNVVTVTLQPDNTVLCGSRNSVITIEGLVGTSTPDTVLPVEMQDKSNGGLFVAPDTPDTVSLSFSTVCKEEDSKVLISGASFNPENATLYFAGTTCKGRFTKITAFDKDSGCATLFKNANDSWSDNATACTLGSVTKIDVTQRGSGFKAGAFDVTSDVGSGLTGSCAVDDTGAVTSINVTTPGRGYNKDVRVRCPRKCSSNTSATSACGADTPVPSETYGLFTTPVLGLGGAKITSVCDWEQSAGRLTCALQGCAKSNADTEFSFTLTNADVAQPSQTVNVMAGGHIAIPAVALDGDENTMKIDIKSAGKNKVEMGMVVTLNSNETWNASQVDKYKAAVAAAGGVNKTKVAVMAEELTNTTVLKRSVSYLKPIDKTIRMSVTVDAESMAHARFVATALTADRINEELRVRTTRQIRIPAENVPIVVETPMKTMAAECKCQSSDVTAAKTCECTHEFDVTGINSDTFLLSAETQYNSASEISAFKVGNTSAIPASGVKLPSKDECGSYDKVLSYYDVTSLVEANTVTDTTNTTNTTTNATTTTSTTTTTRKLQVAITAEDLEQDYCGAGDVFKTVLVLHYN